ncbi:hypothetical protein EVAR_59166_1 [Eumeta japonica]|uniref:Uncharacterized protein n=1 Tax=Eumeta variegata TaxID=151549 RepID=A0A4C1YX30_EUMVA|nr:hypothetical protein EVAR_59166_1 [Eumeta japonica]
MSFAANQILSSGGSEMIGVGRQLSAEMDQSRKADVMDGEKSGFDVIRLLPLALDGTLGASMLEASIKNRSRACQAICNLGLDTPVVLPVTIHEGNN